MRYAEQAALVHNIPEHIVRLVKEAFVTGTMWADEHPKNVWHSASEEPKAYNIEILVEDAFGTRCVCDIHDVAGDWDYFCRDIALVRWVYIADLLPKGGKK